MSDINFPNYTFPSLVHKSQDQQVSVSDKSDMATFKASEYYHIGTSTYTISNKKTIFREAELTNEILHTSLSPKDFLDYMSEQYAMEAFQDLFAFAHRLGIVTKEIFDYFVFTRGFHSLYILCPEHQTPEDTIRLVKTIKKYHFISYLSEDIRNDTELKREINRLKIMGYFDTDS